MFSYEVICLWELLQIGVNFDSLIKLVCLDIVLASFLVLALIREDFTLKPCIIQVFNLEHFLSHLAQINVLKLTDVHEGFLSKVEFFCK